MNVFMSCVAPPCAPFLLCLCTPHAHHRFIPLPSTRQVDEACDIIQDVHVETYGSLDKKEKADFLLEQIRLTLAKKDFVRTIIISKKVGIRRQQRSVLASWGYVP